MTLENIDQIQFHRVKNDVNGNGRLVIHFLDLITGLDFANAPDDLNRISTLYALALSKAKKIGGKKYHVRSFGGGIVFTNYESNLRKELKSIL